MLDPRLLWRLRLRSSADATTRVGPRRFRSLRQISFFYWLGQRRYDLVFPFLQVKQRLRSIYQAQWRLTTWPPNQTISNSESFCCFHGFRYVQRVPYLRLMCPLGENMTRCAHFCFKYVNAVQRLRRSTIGVRFLTEVIVLPRGKELQPLSSFFRRQLVLSVCPLLRKRRVCPWSIP